MDKDGRKINVVQLKAFSRRIQSLIDAADSQHPASLSLLGTIFTLLVLRSLSSLVIRIFITEWTNASCTINSGGECAEVLARAVTVKDQLATAHLKLITLPSPFARWAGRRLIAPMLDWKDLVLDLSIASDKDIQKSLCELEDLL